MSANRLGLSALALGVVAGAGFFARRLVFRDQWLAQLVIGGLASLLFSSVLWALLSVGGLGWALSAQGALRIFRVALMSMVIAPFCFRAFDYLRVRLGELSAEEAT